MIPAAEGGGDEWWRSDGGLCTDDCEWVAHGEVRTRFEEEEYCAMFCFCSFSLI